MGEPVEVANAAPYLASDDSSFSRELNCSSMAAERKSGPNEGFPDTDCYPGRLSKRSFGSGELIVLED
jgi:hypothetical protein